MSLTCRRKRQGRAQEEAAKAMSSEARQHRNRFSRKHSTRRHSCPRRAAITQGHSPVSAVSNVSST